MDINTLLNSNNALAVIGATFLAAVLWGIRQAAAYVMSDLIPWGRTLAERIATKHIEFIDQTEAANTSNATAARATAEALAKLCEYRETDSRKLDDVHKNVAHFPCLFTPANGTPNNPKHTTDTPRP